MEQDVGQTLLGGGLAALGGAAVLWIERLGARRDAKLARAEVKSAQVLAVVMNIQQMHAWHLVIKRAIDECFDSVDDPEGKIDPGTKVLPLIMPSLHPRPFTGDELGLAFETGDKGLVEKLMLVQTNFFATIETLREFNALRKEHMSFVQAAALEGHFENGEAANVILPAKLKHAHESRVALLNQLVGALMTATTNDAVDCRKTIDRFLSAARSIDGVSVPSVTMPSGGKEDAAA